MHTNSKTLRREVLAELDALPKEYHSLLLQMIRTYRESVTLKPAARSFAQGWREARRGEVRPIRQLWEGIDGR
jgi:hypothetical protein